MSVREEDSGSLVSRSLVYFVIFFLPLHTYSSNFFPLYLSFLLYFTSDNTAYGRGLETFRNCIICDIARLFDPAVHCGLNCTAKCPLSEARVTRNMFRLWNWLQCSRQQLVAFTGTNTSLLFTFSFINIHTEMR